MSDLALGLQAARVVGGLFGFGILVVLALTLVRRRKAEVDGAAPLKKVPLWARYLTLVFLALVVLFPAYLSEWSFFTLVTLLVLLALREFWTMLAAGGVHAHRLAGYAGGLAILGSGAMYGVSGLGVGIVAATLLVLPTALFSGELPTLPARAGGTLLGVLYVAGLGSFLELLRHGSLGFGRVLFFLMVIQLADVFGLVGGLAFGKRALAPTLSPGKTWEGTIGSGLAALAGAWLFAFAIPELPVPIALVYGAVLFVASLLGDLLASGFKRAVGLKDYSALLPGHGGILDRFDGYLFAAPIAWALFNSPAF